MKDTMSIKISVMHYMKWTSKRVMLPVVFEEFEMIYIFLLLFFLFKRSTLAKIWGLEPPQLRQFLRACYYMVRRKKTFILGTGYLQTGCLHRNKCKRHRYCKSLQRFIQNLFSLAQQTSIDLCCHIVNEHGRFSRQFLI